MAMLNNQRVNLECKLFRNSGSLLPKLDYQRTSCKWDTWFTAMHMRCLECVSSICSREIGCYWKINYKSGKCSINYPSLIVQKIRKGKFIIPKVT